jgi:hypothetical protein
MLASVCFCGGPLVNKLGVKWALVIGAMSFPIQGSSYYCNSKFGNQWVSTEGDLSRPPKKKTKLTVNSTSSLADSYQALVLDAGTSQKPEPS